jgi:hypothetical protein
MTNADSRRIAGTEARDCAWCGEAEFQRENRKVCDRCLNLLRNAGVSDEEIYGPADPAPEKKEPSKRMPGD